MKQISKFIFIGIGFLFLGIGSIGILVPVMPTVPFLIIAAFCFAKGSKRIHKWFESTQMYKKYLHPFLKSRALTLKSKISILFISYVAMGTSFCLFPNIYVRIFLALSALIQLLVLVFYIKTKPNPKKAQNKDSTK